MEPKLKVDPVAVTLDEPKSMLPEPLIAAMECASDAPKFTVPALIVSEVVVRFPD